MDRILVIDSSETTSELIMKYFTRAGFDVVLLRESHAAKTMVSTINPDLILIDSNLKNESGYDVCKRLKSVDDNFIPALILSDSDAPSAALRAIEAGADDYAFKNPDLSVLASKVNSLLRIKRLSDQLKRQYTELAEKNKILDSQLEMAMRVQRTLIRDHKFTHAKAGFYSRYLPALAIGGDYYDIITLDQNRVCVIVGDVSGHGISAALLTAMLHSMARNLAQKNLSPSAFLSRMNREFTDIFENRDNQMYVCMCCAIFDIKGKTAVFSNAGHVFPIHVGRKGKSAKEIMTVGTPVGMLPDSYYENITVSFEDGDSFLFYTDGLCDNFFKEDAEGFIGHLKTVLVDMRDSSEPDAVINSVLELAGLSSLKDSIKYQLDDVSLILCKMP